MFVKRFDFMVHDLETGLDYSIQGTPVAALKKNAESWRVTVSDGTTKISGTHTGRQLINKGFAVRLAEEFKKEQNR